jgi:cyclopropane fatty-acyl-phospholipid synthase-like methyltransferase
VSDAAGRVARGAYRHASAGVRVHTTIRWLTCPFAPIADALADARHVLDVGCGHGLFPLYLASRHPLPEITGVDIDRDKLDAARAAAVAAHLESRVRFDDVDAGWDPSVEPPTRPVGGWDGIAIVDVLYLLGHDRARGLVRAAATVLAPGGRLVVKELDTTPTWKHRISAAQEVLATRVLRITQGDHVDQVPSSVLADELRSAGLEVRTLRLDRGRVHPDYLVVATRS